MEFVYSLNDIQEAVQFILKNCPDRRWAFQGGLGAGKTTLIKNICKELHVVDTVSSPTFSIIHEYLTDVDEQVIHMDWYRIEKIEDLLEAGVEDYLHSEAIIFIEWPERALPFIDDSFVMIQIQNIGDDKRKLVCQIGNETPG